MYVWEKTQFSAHVFLLNSFWVLIQSDQIASTSPSLILQQVLKVSVNLFKLFGIKLAHLCWEVCQFGCICGQNRER